MNIAIDVRSLMEGRHSGVEEYTIQLIQGLIRVAPRHKYHLFYNSYRSVMLPDFGVGRVIFHGFQYPNKLLNISQFLFGFPRWDKMIDQHVDVVLVPNTRLTPLSHTVPMVAVAHDLAYEKFPEFLDMKRHMWHRLMRPRHLIQRADRIIAVSEHTKHDVEHYYSISSERIQVIHSGVKDVVQARPHDIALVRKTYDLPENFILYLGAQEPRKNVPSIVEAFSAIAGSVAQNLVIAGDTGWREGEITQSINQSRMKQRIHRIGLVSDADKAALYSAADLFVYPSFYEGFGFPPLEALVSGTPVITSFNSALPEVVGKWATMIDPHDPAELAAVMKEQLQVTRRVPKEVRQEILDTYSWDKAAKETLAVLEVVA